MNLQIVAKQACQLHNNPLHNTTASINPSGSEGCARKHLAYQKPTSSYLLVHLKVFHNFSLHQSKPHRVVIHNILKADRSGTRTKLLQPQLVVGCVLPTLGSRCLWMAYCSESSQEITSTIVLFLSFPPPPNLLLYHPPTFCKSSSTPSKFDLNSSYLKSSHKSSLHSG